MKNYTPKLILVSSLLAFVAAFAVPAIRAEDAPAKEKKMSKKMLEKYDTNKDGKLDDAEKAAMEADMAKKKAERAEKAKSKAKGKEKADANAKEN